MELLDVYVLNPPNGWPVPESSCASCWNFHLAPGHGRSAACAARRWTCVDSCCLWAWGMLMMDPGRVSGRKWGLCACHGAAQFSRLLEFRWQVSQCRWFCLVVSGTGAGIGLCGLSHGFAAAELCELSKWLSFLMSDEDKKTLDLTLLQDKMRDCVLAQ